MAEVATLQTWVNKLLRRKNGEPYPHERNIKIALENAPELKGMFRYNEFSDRVELLRPPPGLPRDDLHRLFDDDDPVSLRDEHITAIIVFLSGDVGFTSLRCHTVQDTVVLVAQQKTVHPVREYLEDCLAGWDGKERLYAWLRDYLGGADDAEYLSQVGQKFLVSAVARIFEPGCQVDSMLVLEGKQGEGKSQAVRILGGDWARDLSGDVADKDAEIAIQGVWIAELSELTAIRRADQEPVKGFISRRIGHYRPPYGRNNIDRPRQTVFIATTNESDYLQDPTGGRRYWPVECRSIDLEGLKRDRNHLWGEAVSLYRAKQPWHLERAQAHVAQSQQAARQRISPVDEVVLEYADRMIDAGRMRIEQRQMLHEVFDISTKQDPGKAGGIAAIAGRALVREGWIKLKPTGRGDKRVQAYEWRPSQGDSQGLRTGSQGNGISQGSQGLPYDSEHANSQGSQGSQGSNATPDDDIPF